MNNSDPSGRAVHSIGIAGDFTLFWGLAISIAVAWDDDGNVGLIWSKSGTGLVNEPYAGIVDVSAQAFYQYTAVDTLDDITGPAINGGLSGGYVIAGGFDVVNVPGKEGSLHGFKVGIGAGIGVDGHVSTSTTQIITQKKSEKTRRASVHKVQNNMEHGGTGRGF